MNQTCPHCGKSLFTPRATTCFSCKEDIRYLQRGDVRLERVCVYDRVKMPAQCALCDSVEEVNFEELFIEVEVQEGVRLPLPWFFRFFIKKAERKENGISVGIPLCGACPKESVTMIGCDVENRFIEIFASPAFKQQVMPERRSIDL